LSSAAKKIGWVALGCGALVAIAAFVPWVKVDGGPLGSITVRGIGDDEFGAKDGVITLVLAVPAAAFGLVRALGKKPGGLQLAGAIVILCAGALIVLIALVDIADVEDTISNAPMGFDAQVGEGLYLTLVGGIALAAGVAGIIKRSW
jgi:hypothetical protein